MVPFKNNRGFTFIEVLLAIAIVGLVLSPLFILQTSVVQSISRLSLHLHRIYSAEKFLFESNMDDIQKKEEKIDDPDVFLVYEKKNYTSTEFRDVYSERVMLTWYENNLKYTDTIVALLFKPEHKR